MISEYLRSEGKLPSFCDPRSPLRDALPVLRSPTRITPSDAATRYRRVQVDGLWRPWRNDVAPYMVEPTDMTISRRFNALVFVGPARSSKTESLIMNTIAHRVTCRPENALIVHMNKDSARDFSQEKLDVFIRHSPHVVGHLGTRAGDNNIFDKRFTGMRLSIGWPVISKLSARDLPLVMFSDFDRMDSDIGGEGSPFLLGRKRTETFGSRGMTIIETSPGRPILDEAWKPTTLHEAPPTTGALDIYNEGTRGRLYWTCPDCGEQFEPTFDRLDFPDKVPAAEAAAAVTLPCPGCGVAHGPEDQADLNRSAVWLHETADGKGAVPVDHPDVRQTPIVSYWMQGPAAAFTNWRDLVRRYVSAKESFDRTGEEESLKTTVNTDLGQPYLPTLRAGAVDINIQALKDKAEPYRLGIAPEGTRFITTAVDVQAARFVVQVEAWGPDMERWLIDRFDLHEPPSDAPMAARRVIDPPGYVEDWKVLRELWDRVYPVTGLDFGLRPVLIVIDSQGAAGTTTNAYDFWRDCKRDGFGAVFHLLRGDPRQKRKVWRKYPESSNQKDAVASDVPILFVSPNPLKDSVSASLIRTASGPFAYHLPSGLSDDVLREFTAERRTEKGWEVKAGHRRNESLDLAVYNLAAAMAIRAQNVEDWSAPPAWGLPPDQGNPFAVEIAQGDHDGALEMKGQGSAARRRGRFKLRSRY